MGPYEGLGPLWKGVKEGGREVGESLRGFEGAFGAV